MNSTLGVLNSNLKNRQIFLQKHDPSVKHANPWLMILSNFGLGFVSEILEIAATAIFGPVAGAIIGVGLDIGFNIIADAISGQNPWELNSVVFNVALPLTSVPGRIKGLSKVRRSKVLGLGDALDDSNLRYLANRLNSIDVSDTKAVNAAKRQYSRVLSEFNHLDLLSVANKNELIAFQKRQSMYNKNLAKLSKYWSKFNNGLSMVANPDQFVQSLAHLMASPIRKKWNKSFSNFTKNLPGRSIRLATKTIERTLIPLNHTKAAWISGVRVFHNPAAIGWYNVCIFFDPELTNNKPPVWIFNKPLKNIMQFINAPSAGHYYINNISWGWEIGKMLRVNDGFGILSKFNSIAKASYISQFYFKFSRTSKLVMQLIDKMQHIDQYSHEWNTALTVNLGSNLLKGSTKGIKGVRGLSRVYRTLETGESRHIIRYTESKIKSGTRKLMKTYKPPLVSKIITRGK